MCYSSRVNYEMKLIKKATLKTVTKLNIRLKIKKKQYKKWCVSCIMNYLPSLGSSSCCFDLFLLQKKAKIPALIEQKHIKSTKIRDRMMAATTIPMIAPLVIVGS